MDIQTAINSHSEENLKIGFSGKFCNIKQLLFPSRFIDVYFYLVKEQLESKVCIFVFRLD